MSIYSMEFDDARIEEFRANGAAFEGRAVGSPRAGRWGAPEVVEHLGMMHTSQWRESCYIYYYYYWKNYKSVLKFYSYLLETLCQFQNFSTCIFPKPEENTSALKLYAQQNLSVHPLAALPPSPGAASRPVASQNRVRPRSRSAAAGWWRENWTDARWKEGIEAHVRYFSPCIRTPYLTLSADLIGGFQFFGLFQ